MSDSYMEEYLKTQARNPKLLSLSQAQLKYPYLPLPLLGRFRRHRREYGHLKQLSAAVQRYKTLIESDLFWGSFADIESGEQALREALERCSEIRPYLKKSEGNSRKALAFASIDAGELEELRQRDWWGSNGRVLASKVLVPILLIFFTAIVGNNVATLLQEKSFQRTKSFELLTRRLTEGEKISVELFLRARDSHYWIVTRERDGLLDSKDAETLRDHQRELRRLERFAVGVDKDNRIMLALKAANDAINVYIKCVEEPSPSGYCHTDFNPQSFSDVRAAFSEVLISHLGHDPDAE